MDCRRAQARKFLSSLLLCLTGLLPAADAMSCFRSPLLGQRIWQLAQSNMLERLQEMRRGRPSHLRALRAEIYIGDQHDRIDPSLSLIFTLQNLQLLRPPVRLIMEGMLSHRFRQQVNEYLDTGSLAPVLAQQIMAWTAHHCVSPLPTLTILELARNRKIALYPVATQRMEYLSPEIQHPFNGTTVIFAGLSHTGFVHHERPYALAERESGSYDLFWRRGGFSVEPVALYEETPDFDQLHTLPGDIASAIMITKLPAGRAIAISHCRALYQSALSILGGQPLPTAPKLADPLLQDYNNLPHYRELVDQLTRRAAIAAVANNPDLAVQFAKLCTE